MSSTRPRICGARIALTQDMWRPAYDAGPGKPGLVRGSLVCELAEHAATGQHCGVARRFPGPLGGAAWALWVDGGEPSFVARDDCARTGALPAGAQESCLLFERHPDPCMSAQDAYAQSPTRLPRAFEALKALGEAGRHEPAAVRAAAEEAALLTWDELRSRDVWAVLAGWEHAAVYRLMSWAHSRTLTPDVLSGLVRELTGFVRHCEARTPSAARPGAGGEEAVVMLDRLGALPEPWQAAVLGDQREETRGPALSFSHAPRRSRPRPGLDQALADAAESSARGEPPPPAAGRYEWDLADRRRLGATAYERLVRLPHEWQVDAVRQIAAGTEAISAVSDAAGSINIIRGFGVYLAWNAPHHCHPPHATQETTTAH
ncbi:MAG: hypothetical protein JO362_00485 [Streptomycetaceae bacterium]|nr:hypothetical protein [Streptomycetaceae bacterium]